MRPPRTAVRRRGLGHREEELLERRRARHERGDADPASPSATDSSAAVRSSPSKRGRRGSRPRRRSGRRSPRRARRRSCAQLVAAGGARDQVVERALVEHAAGADDRHAVAQLLDLGHQVAREQDRDALVGEPADQQAHVAHAGRVEAGGRLVEQQQPRRAAAPRRCRGAGACRASSRRPCPWRGRRGRRCRAPRRSGRGSVAVERRHQLEVAAARQVRVEARRLDEAGDAVERGRPFDERVAPEQPRRALVGPDQAEQHPQRRRLAGPVGPEVAVDVTGPTVRSTWSTAVISP